MASLYGLLIQHFPSIGARAGQAVALAEAGSVSSGLAVLQSVPAAEVAAYQPYWVALAHLQRLAGDASAAHATLQRALGLTADARVREHLMRAHTPRV